eukprot:CAMPEP_0173299114 /NCGR_PEP_ID=MMETSP1143-20121109/16495_1 /TAXON_ID=483371 /ORGANISM="non described non described, Strain CCMP2298" /LENGTH=127 /DNA_ID=CAMNT_0014239359 /DNA_START=701 /DNA_END=1081 /DNA_ORIENTATION=+
MFVSHDFLSSAFCTAERNSSFPSFSKRKPISSSASKHMRMRVEVLNNLEQSSTDTTFRSSNPQPIEVDLLLTTSVSITTILKFVSTRKPAMNNSPVTFFFSWVTTDTLLSLLISTSFVRRIGRPDPD